VLHVSVLVGSGLIQGGGVQQVSLSSIMPSAPGTTLIHNFVNNPLKRKLEDDDYDQT